MVHSSHVIATLAIALSAALIGGLIATRLRLPVVVGYLLAGVAIGPFTPGFVADQQLAAQFAELGVILLMFNVGMHFSLKSIVSVWHIAVPGAAVQICIATALGFLAGKIWGWTPAASFLFGLCLSVASTVVLVRALQKSGQLHTDGGTIAVAWLIVEDLVMIAALVLLPAVTGQTTASDTALSLYPVIISLGKTTAFIVLILTTGPKLFRWLMLLTGKTASGELSTLAFVTVSISLAYGAAQLFGISFALGAFFAGVVLHQSGYSAQARESLQPFEFAFGVLFFVGVGMLFDPQTLLKEPLKVLTVLTIIIVGKSLAAALILGAARYQKDVLLLVAAALTQIGEFSFMLAEMGKGAGVLTDEQLQLIVAGALLSITLNPLCMRIAAPKKG